MRRKLKRKPILIVSTIALSSITAIGYWYVFIAGAPQLDAPQVEEVQGLKFQVKSFYSPAMGETRKYGVILPPGYEKHPHRRYPVIFLLHGGHGDKTITKKRASLQPYKNSIAPIGYRLH
jgi:predicted peptidase